MNIHDQQTEVFNKYGVFFAFSNKQFDESKKDGVKYTSLGAGMIAPVEHAKTVMTEIIAIGEAYRKNDLSENGKKKIIHRELANHEAQITGDIDDTVDALEGYGITRAEVQAEFGEYMDYCIKHDLF